MQAIFHAKTRQSVGALPRLVGRDHPDTGTHPHAARLGFFQGQHIVATLFHNLFGDRALPIVAAGGTAQEEHGDP
jgi:ATP sulfurylase